MYSLPQSLLRYTILIYVCFCFLYAFVGQVKGRVEGEL
jgi:hypothetical protein